MNPTLLTLATFASVTFLAIGLISLAYDAVFRYRDLVGDRLADELSDHPEGQSVGSPLFRDLKQLPAQSGHVSRIWYGRAAEILEQSGLEISVGQVFLACLLTGPICGAAIYLATGLWWLAVIVTPVAAILPVTYVRHRRKTRLRKLSRQLPEAFEVMSRAVRAGQTVPAALRIIADDFDPPISTEFAHCCEQQNLGIPQELALRNLARRSGIMELRIFALAMLVQSRSGGNLTDLLSNLASTVRKRLKLHEKVQALTGEGRMQAAVLLALPIIGLIALLILSPDYAGQLLDRPWLLVCAAIAQGIGALWIRKIVNFDF